jgi:hypothetical protein
MNLFSKRALLFLGIPFCLSLLLFVLLYHFNSKLLSKYRLDSQVNTLIVGDSRTAYAFNDKLLSNTVNISQTSEGFIYSFPILQGILKSNPQIKTVLLGFSYQSISSYYDKSMFGPHIASRYFYILPREVQLEIFEKNKSNLMLVFRKIVTNGIWNLLSKPNNYSFIGKYETYKTDIPLTKATIDKRIASQYYESGKLLDFAEINTAYFIKIVNLCKQSNIKLIILNTPMHKYYLSSVPLQYKEKYYGLLKEHNLDLIEFDTLAMADTCFLPDGDHLSTSGTEPATRYLKKVLSEKPDLNVRKE